MVSPSISILVPAYNEEATLRGVYDEVRAMLEKTTPGWEIIFCDDASRDGTRAVIEGIAASEERVRAIFHGQNQGIYRTFEELYAAARKDLVMLLPGDGQWPAAAVPQALGKMGGHAVVIAARRDKQYTWFRSINSWAFNRLVRSSFGVELYDIGAAKLWRREVLQSVTVKSRSLFNEAERLIKVHRKGGTIGVVTVDHRPRAAGKAAGAKPGNIIAAFKDLVAFRLGRL